MRSIAAAKSSTSRKALPSSGSCRYEIPAAASDSARRFFENPGINESDALDLLRRVVDARGGLMALKAVRTVVAETITTFQMQQGTLPSTTKTYIVYPNKFRVDAEINGAQTTQVFNAGAAWVKDPKGIRDAPPEMAADFAASVRRDIIPLLTDAAEGRLTVRKGTDQAARDGRGVQVLEISGSGVDRAGRVRGREDEDDGAADGRRRRRGGQEVGELQGAGPVVMRAAPDRS